MYIYTHTYIIKMLVMQTLISFIIYNMASSLVTNHIILRKTLMILLIINFLNLIQTTSSLTNSTSTTHFSRFSKHGQSSKSRTKQKFLESVQESISYAHLAHILALNHTQVVDMDDPIHDCLELLEDTLEMLLSIKKMPKKMSRDEEEDVHTWLSASLTNQETCIESIQEQSMPYKTGFVMASYARNLSVLLTNSLDLFLSFKSKRHDKPLSENESFPRFVASAEQQKLLEASLEDLHVDAVVAADGSGGYRTVGEALLAFKTFVSSSGRTVIYIKTGVYQENVEITKKQKNVMLVGDGKGKTVITGDRSNGTGYRTFTTATVAVKGDGFIACNLTIRNTAGPKMNQAVALRVGSDKSVVYRCSIEGYQDTLYTHSKKQFYRESDIFGTVDFIFGNAAVIFQSCNITAVKPLPGHKNIVTAQGRSSWRCNSGISIQNCRITAESETYLGRPWRNYSRTVVMESYLDGWIHRLGWYPWSGGFGLETLFYGEFRNSGPGSSVLGRVNWTGYHSVLTVTEAERFTVACLICGDSWLPSTGVSFESGLGLGLVK